MKLRCYFAHPFRSIGLDGEKRIIEILESRRVEVVNPFTGENDMAKKYGVDAYYPKTPYKLGRDIWTKDLSQLNQCNMALFWIPEDKDLPPIYNFMTTARGCYAEIQHAVEYQNMVLRRDRLRREEDKKGYFIQIITKDRHPIIAWALCNGNQLYDDIDSFERFRQKRWK